MYYYRFHIGDYKRSTDHLTNGEDIAYRRLLDMYYETESVIPLETKQVARRLRLDLNDLQIVLDEFFEKTEQGYLHHYCESQIQEYQKGASVRRVNGQKGGRRKKDSLEQTKQEPVNNLAGSEQGSLTNNHKPITNNHIKDMAPPEGVLESVWEDFVNQRKAKKASITPTAIKGIEREARKAGISLNDALQEICSRGWAGFKADWMTDKTKTSWADKQREWVAEATGKAYEPDVFDIAIAQTRGIK
jgi:uncharacterized protein YdaU (DUF1376 family)